MILCLWQAAVYAMLYAGHQAWERNDCEGCKIKSSPYKFCRGQARPVEFSMSELNGNTGLRLKTGLAEMLKGGVIMDVTDARQAEIAEKAGAAAVMALERVPAQIRAQGGVARMASPKKIREI